MSDETKKLIFLFPQYIHLLKYAANQVNLQIVLLLQQGSKW